MKNEKFKRVPQEFEKPFSRKEPERTYFNQPSPVHEVQLPKDFNDHRMAYCPVYDAKMMTGIESATTGAQGYGKMKDCP